MHMINSKITKFGPNAEWHSTFYELSQKFNTLITYDHNGKGATYTVP